jgi:hypothetical protein
MTGRRSPAPLTYILALVAGYVLGWTLSYIVLVGTDFQHYYDYLYLAWTGPGEIPVFVTSVHGS